MDSPKGINWLSASSKAAEAWPRAWQLPAIWLVWRLLSSLFAAFISNLIPLTRLEKEIPLLPPSLPTSAWLERALLAPWMRWDSLWFTRIVTQGYQVNDGTTLFHPLYPWLATIPYRLGLHPTLSLLLVSTTALLLLLYCYERPARQDLQPSEVRFSTLLFLLCPSAFILFAPYTESLFLLLAVLCLLWTRQKSWWLACLAGGLAALTRQQGVLLAIPVAWELWDSTQHKLPHAAKNWKNWLALGLIPAGFLAWSIYRLAIFDDLQPGTNLFQRFYALLISPSGTQVVPVHGLRWPWQIIDQAVSQLIHTPNWDVAVNLALGAGLLLLLAAAWPRLRWSDRLYSLAVAILSISFYTGPEHPYMGMPRHLLLAVPVFIGAAPLFNRPWKRLLIIASSTAGWFFMLTLFMLEAWVP